MENLKQRLMNVGKKLIIPLAITTLFGLVSYARIVDSNRDYNNWRESKNDAKEYRIGNPKEDSRWKEYFAYDIDNDGNIDSVREKEFYNIPLNIMKDTRTLGLGYGPSQREFHHILADIENGFAKEIK